MTADVPSTGSPTDENRPRPLVLNCCGCHQPIRSRDDLMATWWLFLLRGFHLKCYGHAIKGWRDLYIGSIPVNSIAGMLFCLSLISGGLDLWLQPGSLSSYPFLPTWVRWPLGAVMLFLGVLPRPYCYFAWERRLPDFSDEDFVSEGGDESRSPAEDGIPLVCEDCNKEIGQRIDLVVVVRFIFSIVPLHAACFSRDRRTFHGSLYTLEVALNGRFFLLLTLATIAWCSYVALDSEFLPLLVISLPLILLRGYSWVRYESKLR